MKRAQAPNARRRFAEPQQRRNRLHWPGLRTLPLSLALLAGLRWASAAQVSQENVGKAVETWVRHVTAEPRADAVVERIEPYRENGLTMAYVVHLANGGYCLAGADSLVLPVYFYCPKGVYDAKNPNCRVILAEIADRQGFLSRDATVGGATLKAHQAALSHRARLWEDLASGKAPAGGGAQPLDRPVPPGGPVPQGGPSGPVSMVLPVTSQWDQSPPWGDFCPTLPPGATPAFSNLTVVGCVATSTSQLMYYWRWPNSGVGSGTDTYNYSGTSTPLTTSLANNPGIPSDFQWHLSWANGVLTIKGWWDGSMYSQAQQFTNASSVNPAAYENALTSLYNRLTSYHDTLSANFTTPIDWGAMQGSYADPSDPSPVNNAEKQVANLCYEVGVAVQMNYGVSESLSSDGNIPAALTSHFGYDPDAADTNPPNPDTMVLEIQWLRPFIMGGSGPPGGHSWLIYGYNMATSPWQFKMNMGWGGQYDTPGWYSLDTVPRGLTNNMDHVTGLAPQNVVGFVGAGSSGRGSPNSPYQNIQEALSKAPNGATLIFQANSVNTFSSAPLVINRPLTLKGYNATITK